MKKIFIFAMLSILYLPIPSECQNKIPLRFPLKLSGGISCDSVKALLAEKAENTYSCFVFNMDFNIGLIKMKHMFVEYDSIKGLYTVDVFGDTEPEVQEQRYQLGVLIDFIRDNYQFDKIKNLLPLVSKGRDMMDEIIAEFESAKYRIRVYSSYDKEDSAFRIHISFFYKPIYDRIIDNALDSLNAIEQKSKGDL